MKVSVWLMERGWDVFFPLSEISKVDLVATKNGRTKRIQVKTTNTLSKNGKQWLVDIRNLNASSTNSIMVWIEPEQRVVEFKPWQIVRRRQLSVALKTP